MNDQPIILEEVFNVPVQKVWGALTDREEMKHWYFSIENFKPEKECEFSFMSGPPGKNYLHLCKITEVIPGTMITYSWRYDEYAGNSFVTFQLTPHGESTKLTLTHKGIESFPDSNPDFKKENFAEGWKSIIGSSLKAYLEK